MTYLLHIYAVLVCTVYIPDSSLAVVCVSELCLLMLSRRFPWLVTPVGEVPSKKCDKYALSMMA